MCLKSSFTLSVCSLVLWHGLLCAIAVVDDMASVWIDCYYLICYFLSSDPVLGLEVFNFLLVGQLLWMVKPNCIFCLPWWTVWRTALWIVRSPVIFHIWDCRGWLAVEPTMGNGISIGRFIAFWKVLVLIIKLLELLTPIAKWDRLSWLTQNRSTSHWLDSNPVCYSHSLDSNLVRFSKLGQISPSHKNIPKTALTATLLTMNHKYK